MISCNSIQTGCFDRQQNKQNILFFPCDSRFGIYIVESSISSSQKEHFVNYIKAMVIQYSTSMKLMTKLRWELSFVLIKNWKNSSSVGTDAAFFRSVCI